MVSDRTERFQSDSRTPDYERVRAVLAGVLVFLLLLLAGLLVVVARLLSPLGAPDDRFEGDGLVWVRSIYGWGRAEHQQLRGPSDVAIGPDGTIWVSDAQRWQVVGFRPDGDYRTIVHLGPGVFFPQSIAVSEKGEIYICDYAHDRIVVMSSDSRLLREWPVPRPTEIDVREGMVIVGSRAGVARYDEEGGLITFWGQKGTADDQFDLVRGVVIGPDKTVYVSDTHNRRVKAYTDTGTLLWVYPTQADFERYEADEELEPPFQIPAGMTFDGAGRLVVADPFEFAVVVLDPKTGAEIARHGRFGIDDGRFAYPTSISYDPVRDWFAVADTSNNRVQVVRIPGSGGDALAALRRAMVGPWWVCVLPLLLLLLALALMRRRARRRREAEQRAAVAATLELAIATSEVKNDTEQADGME